MNEAERERLRELAEPLESSNAHGPWVWQGGYPQRVTNAAAVLLADTFDDPDQRAPLAEFIAAVDPATVLRLLNDLDAAEKERDALRLATVEAVLDLMQDAGTLEARADTIYPHANGYSCWFRDGGLGTAPLSAEEILARIDARALSRLGAGGEEG